MIFWGEIDLDSDVSFDTDYSFVLFYNPDNTCDE